MSMDPVVEQRWHVAFWAGVSERLLAGVRHAWRMYQTGRKVTEELALQREHLDAHGKAVLARLDRVEARQAELAAMVPTPDPTKEPRE